VAALRLEDILLGIELFEAEYTGTLALEMMFVKANKGFATEMAAIARELAPDEVQVNTPLRPCAVSPLTASEIAAIRDEFTGLPVRSVYEAARPTVTPLNVRETLRRRPASPRHRKE
jgi:wyosine [tRNA(Phe)-imidazoG37] synthetase (radical SAM superfamily)